MDWLIRTYLPAFLELTLPVHAARVRSLAPIVDFPSARVAFTVGSAAWEAASRLASDVTMQSASGEVMEMTWDLATAAVGMTWPAARAAARAAADVEEMLHMVRMATSLTAMVAARQSAMSTSDRAVAEYEAGGWTDPVSMARREVWAAAKAALDPTLDALQASMIELLWKMIDPRATA